MIQIKILMKWVFIQAFQALNFSLCLYFEYELKYFIFIFFVFVSVFFYSLSCLKNHTTMDSEILQFLKDFPSGPLCSYRKTASFNWKEMCLVMDSKDSLLLKVLPAHPTFFLIQALNNFFFTSIKFGKLLRTILYSPIQLLDLRLKNIVY